MDTPEPKPQPKPASEMTDRELVREWRCVERGTDSGARNYELAREMDKRGIDV
jgi:hypothetical protein